MKTFSKICAAVLSVMILFGTVAGIGRVVTGTWDIRDWGKKIECIHVDKDGDGVCDKCKKAMPAEDEKTPANENGGATVNESAAVNNGVKLMSARIAPAAYAAKGVSPQADSAYALTATVLPENATNKLLDWSVAWVNSNSAWAKGKSVSDYMTVTPTADGSATANVECKKAFGEQITVTATSRDNRNATAACTFDYAQKITGANLSFGNINCVTDGYTDLIFDVVGRPNTNGGKVSFTQTYSDYTVADTFTISIVKDGSNYEYHKVGELPFDRVEMNTSLDNVLYEMLEQGETNLSNGGNVYTDLSFFDDCTCGYSFSSVNASFSDNFMGNEGLTNAYMFLSEVSKLPADDVMAYLPIEIKITGKYSEYTYTTKLRFAGYTAINVTGVNMDKTSVLCY